MITAGNHSRERPRPDPDATSRPEGNLDNTFRPRLSCVTNKTKPLGRSAMVAPRVSSFRAVRSTMHGFAAAAALTCLVHASPALAADSGKPIDELIIGSITDV